MRERAARDFGLEGFRDFLALESGHSENTVVAYLGDLQRLAEFALSRGVRDPGQVTRTLLRDFVYLSVQLSTTFSSSDVQLVRGSVRGLAIVHSVVAFAYSTAIIAVFASLLISIAA